MLVLSRKPGEKVIVDGGRITLWPTWIARRRVELKIAFDDGRTLLERRRIGEWTRLFGDVHVVITRIGPGRVGLGFDAPQEIVIDREERHAARKTAALTALKCFEQAIFRPLGRVE